MTVTLCNKPSIVHLDEYLDAARIELGDAEFEWLAA